jgi:hypothetical protein
LAPYFLIVQSEELLLLKPVILTKNSMVHDLAWRKCSSGIFFVPSNVAPLKIWMYSQNEGKMVKMKKPVGMLLYVAFSTINQTI